MATPRRRTVGGVDAAGNEEFTIPRSVGMRGDNCVIHGLGCMRGGKLGGMSNC